MLMIPYLFPSQFQCLGSRVERWSAAPQTSSLHHHPHNNHITRASFTDVFRHNLSPIKVNMKESQTDLNKISVHKPLTNCGPSLVSKSTHLIPIAAKWPWQTLLYIRERQNLSQHIKLRWSKLKCNRSEWAVNEVSMDHDRSGWSVTILIQLDGWWLYRVIAPWDHPLLSGLESK